MTAKYKIMEDTQSQPPNKTETGDRTPDDKGSILVEAFLRIKDPNSQEILVETRA